MMNASFRNRIADFFGLNKNITSMIIMVVLIMLGEKMGERFLPLYILAIGGTNLAVGFLNAMDNLISALYSFPGGFLSDKIGYKKALMLFTSVAMLGYLIVIIFQSWEAVFAGSVLFIAWSAVSLPAIMSLISKAVPSNRRTMGVTVHSLVKRIPMSLGPLLGGTFISIYGTTTGIRISFITAFVLGIVALFAIHFLMEDKDVKRSTNSIKDLAGLKSFSPPLWNLLVSDILIRFAEQIPYAFVVVWCVNILGISAFQFGVLTVVEMITAMLVYIPVAYYADRYYKKPFILITFVFFTIFPLVIYFSQSFALLIVAFVIRGLKEFGEPTRKALIMDLAPEDAKAETFGTYYLIRDVIVSAAALSSAFLWNVSPFTNFFTAFVCGLIGTIWFAIWGKDIKP
ncbi:MAG: MFS transporter [bacterium]|nr:MFS transporter [bacterium]